MRRITVEILISTLLDLGATPQIPMSAGKHATFLCAVSIFFLFSIPSYIFKQIAAQVKQEKWITNLGELCFRSTGGSSVHIMLETVK